MRNRRRPQLRACTVCHKPGHNKARCPIFLATQQTENDLPSNSAVKMVLHEKKQPTRSPHLVDLKPKHNPWKEIATFSPTYFADCDSSTPEKSNSERPLHTQVNLGPAELSFTNKIIGCLEAWRENRKAKKDMAKMERAMLKKQAAFTNATPNEAPSLNKPTEQSPLQSLAETTSGLPVYKSENIEKIEPAQTQASSPIDDSSGAQPLEPFKKIISLLFWRTAIIIFICVVPFQAHSYYKSIKTTTNQIAAEGTKGFMALQESTTAILSANIESAENSAAEALKKFENAIKTMQENHRLLQKIISVVPVASNEVQSRQKLITAGQKIALGNQFLIKGVSESQQNVDNPLTERIKIMTDYLKAAAPNFNAALDDLSAIDSKVLPPDLEAPFKDFRLLFATFLNDLNNFIDLGQIVDEVFGAKGYRRYLIVFQNPHELRPTGGFVGSFALMDIKDGKIVSLNIPSGGSYSLQGQLDVSVEPPVPLLLSNRRWEFQDANWFPDFPASAEKMLWFYRHARKITADGVIAVNATVLERLIAVLGPITDEKRSITLSSSTAIARIQQIVEDGPEKKTNQPKQIIADLAPQIIGYVYGATPDKTMPLIVNLAEALENKEIQAYFIDEKTESTINSFGWGGQILSTKPDQDYLLVVNTNIQGQKTDAKIQQSISHEVVVNDDGSIVDTVVITREHTGTPEEKLYGTANIDYIRVYVPKGSELISAGGFTWPDERRFRAPIAGSDKDDFLAEHEKEIKIDDQSGTRITEEFGKTAFGNWLILEPGETRQVQFTYRLPFKIDLNASSLTSEQNIFQKIFNENSLTSRYQLVIQKQSGIKSTFESQIIYPAPWHPNWAEGEDIVLAGNGIGIGPIDLISDELYSLLMIKNNN